MGGRLSVQEVVSANQGMGFDSVRIQKKPAPFPVQAPRFKTLTAFILH
jgi:hypothetical protein